MRPALLGQRALGIDSTLVRAHHAAVGARIDPTTATDPTRLVQNVPPAPE